MRRHTKGWQVGVAETAPGWMEWRGCNSGLGRREASGQAGALSWIGEAHGPAGAGFLEMVKSQSSVLKGRFIMYLR
jgi:hypothetical protein